MRDADMIQAFIEAQAAELDAARNTQLAYARDLGDASAWLSARALDFHGAQQRHIE
ncbi:MAG: recombinase XerD, partial [Pseudomonadota bacterium]